MNYKNIEDAQLVSLCLKGDAKAWETLIQRYRRLIFSVPNRFGFSEDDCSDIYQAVCLLLIEHLSKLKDESKFSSWLLTTTVRQCIALRARHKRETRDEDESPEPIDPTEDLETFQIQLQREQALRDAVMKMSDRCRNLIEMLYFDKKDPSYESIGQALQMPVSSIGPNRIRCLAKLRTLLQDRGFR